MKRIVVALLVLIAGTAFGREISSTIGTPMMPVAYTGTDTAANIVTAYQAGTNANTTKTIGAMLITVETNSLRLACGGGTPTQGGSPDLGILLVNGASILLEGSDFVGGCSVINAVNASNAIVQFLPFWNP